MLYPDHFHLSSIVPLAGPPRLHLGRRRGARRRGGGAAGPPCGGGGEAERYDGWMENHRKPLENGDFSWDLMAKLRKNLGKPMGKWENHRKTVGKCRVYMDSRWSIYGLDWNLYPLVSSNMGGWKIPDLNGGCNRKITYKWSIF